jgi:tRNA U34 5-carboxymethylaminomethyl modifying GTPase MnmE/TrmE
MAGHKGNKYAEKWTIEKAIELCDKIVELIDNREIQYLSEIDLFFNKKRGSIAYVLNKYSLYHKVKTKIKQYYPGRNSLYSRSPEEKIKLNESAKKRYHNKLKNDHDFKLRMSISSLMLYHIKNSKAKKQYKSKLDLLDYTIEELKNHLSKQFDKNMSFDNYGKWHIDHIIPCSWFNLSDEEDFKHCWKLSNLKPMWAKDNILKNNRYSENPQLKVF